MYLKSIEVQGFKSFAHKMTFEFHNGITGIVGPNGSGKSNVADAVRWVLGEQSAKQLRGVKMEDVIFSGTETRKQLSYAYVAITLNNSDHKLSTDYEEVTVARRVYRSGESEYLMNGVNCRLRDVQELFFDTGIGKEGYSIIGQGQIEQILSGRPEERRELFDEAAGIVKYKKRKAATEKNLEVEKQNLQRVGDILIELENQVGPLKEQSETAKEYLRLKERLKALDIRMFLLEYEKTREDMVQLSEKRESAESELARNNQQYEYAITEYERLEQDVTSFADSLEGKKTERNNNKIKIEKLEGDVKVCFEQIKADKQNHLHYEERLKSIQENLDNSKVEWEKYNHEKQLVTEKKKELEQERQQCETIIESIKDKISRYKTEVSDRSNDAIGLLNEASHKKTKLRQYETILEQHQQKKGELDRQLIQNKTETGLMEEELTQVNHELEQVTNRIKEAKEQRNQWNNRIRSLERDVEKEDSIYRQIQRNRDIEKTRLDALKNMVERYEGYGQSVRRLMEKKGEFSGVIGVVADVLTVKKEYETAVEIALGGNLQNIVTDTETTAKLCIEYLKKNQFGRATFLPLTNMRGKGVFQSEVLKERGVIGIVSDLVEYEARYKNLAEYLLGRFILVRNMEDAMALAKKYRHTLRIVTLEGELLNPGGSISGGTFRNKSNLIGRRREMEDIKKHIQTLAIEKEEKKNLLERLKEEVAGGMKKASLYGDQINQLQLEENTLFVKKEQVIRNKVQKEEEYRSLIQDGKSIDKNKAEIEESVKGIQNELLDIQKRKIENESKIEERNGMLVQLKEEEKQYREKSSSLNLELSASEQNLQFLQENSNRVENDGKRLREERENLLERKEAAIGQMEDKKRSIEEIREAIQNYRTRNKELKEQIEKETKGKEEITAKQKESLIKKDDLSKTIHELDKETLRLRNQEEKLKEQLDAKINYMWEEYELTYHMAKEYPMEEEDVAASRIRKDMERIKNQIRSLGDVNVNAIEEYKNLSERYHTLKTQHDDLIEAEKALQKIILELDEEMRKRFREKFGEIGREFDQVFKELFGGGKGTIELMDGDDILESEIRIIAQPPGKKLQNMMQLSGGEKALTAISLLFAIQNLKPSPFCLLDEIEATLDDSNIKRFSKYLHKLSKHTQFIVITHRQGTMEAADVLYGITMQEKGVSTMVSVKLIEEQIQKESVNA